MISANGGLPAHRHTPQVTQRWPRRSEPASAYEPWFGVTQQRVFYLLLLETSYFCHHHVLRVFCWEKGEQKHALDRRALFRDKVS